MTVIRKDAGISDDYQCRWWLTRDWGGRWEFNDRRLLFVLLNPSTADAEEDDPTIRRLIGYAERWGYKGFTVMNLFPFRLTEPADLVKLCRSSSVRTAMRSRIARNDVLLEKEAADAEKIVLGWGANGNLLSRGQKVPMMLRHWGHGERLFCLGKTKGGHPKHPLYLSYKEELVPFFGKD